MEEESITEECHPIIEKNKQLTLYPPPIYLV
jgi:hypothetical protein